MKILFVTSNESKVKKAQKALAPFGITVEQVQADLIESRSYDPEVIAKEKAEQAYKQLQCPAMVEDSGFFIRALGGFPMTHVKFSLETLGVEKILKMLESEDDRHAEWRMSVAFVYGPGKHHVSTFIEKGEIAREMRPIKRTPMMSEYWRVYVPTMLSGNKLSLSEMEEEGLEKWQTYVQENNQFMMLGKWLLENHLTT